MLYLFIFSLSEAQEASTDQRFVVLLLQSICMFKSMVNSEVLLPLLISSHHIGIYMMHTYWSFVLCQASFYKVKEDSTSANHHLCPH